MPPDAVVSPVPFSALNGWREADFTGAWETFRASTSALVSEAPALRAAQKPSETLLGLARAVADRCDPATLADVREAFEALLQPLAIETAGFLTGYYEPVVDGSPVRTAAFTAPVLPRPDDLVTLAPGETRFGLRAGYAAACRRPDGTLETYPDRAELEARALGPDARVLVWLRDWTEVFLIQVQGSARVRLPDGRERRLVYAGRNGHPYTSIGRLLVETGAMPLEAMSLDALKAWVRRNGQEPGDRGRSLMQRNKSYVFFGLEPAADDLGPIGGAGLPLTPGRSIAVDRALWAYGLPFWIESEQPVPGFGPEPLRRLFVAQDTGSAIVGPARADLFMGSGPTAGENAGLTRHAARFTVLVPRDP